MMRKLKIVGEFAAVGTKIIDEDTGEQIRNVKKVTWIHEAGHVPVCHIELVGVAIAAVGEDISSIDQDHYFRQRKGFYDASAWQRLKYRLCRAFVHDPLKQTDQESVLRGQK